jgi:hypothetical protein
MERGSSRDERKVRKLNIYKYKYNKMKLSEIFKEALQEAKKKKPSEGLSKKEKSDVVKKAKAGKDIGKKGKGFKDVVSKAKKSGAEDPEAVAGAAFWKNIKREGAEGMDHEVSMAKNSLKSIMQSCADLMNKLGNNERNIPGWIQNHISNAENYIDQAAQGFHELDGHDDEEDDDEEMIQPVDEKKLTKAEKAKKEDIIKSMAMRGGGKDKMGPKQYAIATAQAKKSAE